MQTSGNILLRHFNFAKVLLSIAAITISQSLQAQMDCSVTGKIIEEGSNLPVPFATVVMRTDSEVLPRLLKGVITDENGSFIFNEIESGKYTLQASSVGYKTASISFNISDTMVYDAGIIYLQDSIQLIDEIIVIGDRPKGKTENGRTVFFINKKTVSASGNAPDLLRHIPGIQVDLKQNISLLGSQNILLFVNGKERDKSYISQLNPSLIDRVEIMNTPPSNYDGEATGVINIVLKKGNESGLSAQFFTEVPTSKSIVYSFPNYSIQYGIKKLNLYTSYNGEVNLEDIDETYKRHISVNGQIINISSVEQVTQKNLSHNFHYGFDYHATPRDIISYYGSVNPYSYEQDGKASMDITADETGSWSALREETDNNLNVFNSLYYKHQFRKLGSELVIDLNNSYLRSGNSLSWLNEDETGTASVINTEKPKQISTSIKLEYSVRPGENIMLSSGAKAGVKSIRNETASGFGYNEQTYSFYTMLNYKRHKYSLNLGLRSEYSRAQLMDGVDKTDLSALPYLNFQYRINDQQNIVFSYRRSVSRPDLFQLNPYVYKDNPYTVRKGNPGLEPEFMHRIYAEHSFRLNVSYFSYRLFYEKVNNAITNLTFLNDSSAFETQVRNLGNIDQAGVQFLGSIKMGPLTISPTVRLYNQSTSGNTLAREYNIETRDHLVLETAVSTILSFRHDFAFSGTFQYSTQKYNIQERTFCDALYILSIDKTFKNNLKVGIMTALPFAKTFVYQGTETESQDFTSRYHGNLNLPAVPVMFRIGYQFNAGKEKRLISREKEEIPKRKRTGL
jgi:hypothetical protein